MNEIQLAQWRDIAIKYLPAAQKFREEVKARPTEDRESQSYAMGLWNIADKTIARHEATAAERVAAMVLQALSEWETYDPATLPALNKMERARNPAHNDMSDKDMRCYLMQGILNAIQTLKNVTGCAISLDDPLVYFVEPATSGIDWSEYQQDAQHQYLMGMPGDLDPWMLCDVWDIDTACQLITLGCKLDIEKRRRLIKLPVAAPHFHAFRARTICEVYDRAKSIAELSTMKNQTPANWIKWAQGKGYSVAHLMPADAPAANTTSNHIPTTNWKLKIQAEATRQWKELVKIGCSPARHSIKDDLAKWCRDNKVTTDSSGIYPSASYIYKHVLRKAIWKSPTD